MLNIKNLTIEYNERIVLDNIDISFKRGCVNVIKGESGSGKSSLLNFIGLMQKANRDCKYIYEDINISDFDEKQKSNFRLNKVGFIFQQNNLIQEFTAYENILLPMMINSSIEDKTKKADELIEYIELKELKNSYPSTLSGGEEQRIAIARALANDADIILADEPTAALDAKNAESILNLLIKLAHELNKIVIIVSHDSKVCDIADNVLEIKDKKVICTKSIEPIMDDKLEVDFSLKRKVFNFMRFYTKKRTGDKVLNRVFIVVTTLMAVISMLFANFGDKYAHKQNDFINAISDKSIFLINDTLGINAQNDYADAQALSADTINKISQIPNINKIYPYYEFFSFGFDPNSQDTGRIVISDENGILVDKSYENTTVFDSTKDHFSVEPLFKEENLSYLLEEKISSDSPGVYLTKSIAKKLGITSDRLIGKQIEIQCFVPTKLFDSTATKPQSASDKTTSEESVKIDGAYYKHVTIKSIVTGILSDSYNLQRTETKDSILLNYDQFNEILSENRDTNYGEEFEGFPEKELMPSALIMFANTYEDVPIIKQKLENMSASFNLVNAASDIKTIQNNLEYTKKVMTMVTIVFIGIVIIMFSMLYYVKNRSRKKEIGILKALGLTKLNILGLISFEMWKIAIKSFCSALILSILITFISNALIGIDVFVITGVSIVVGMFVSVFIVILAGILPAYKASSIDPIVAIRQINK